jgi:predicted GNAT family acetyltransferase
MMDNEERRKMGMFADTSRICFEAQVGNGDMEWWQTRFMEPFGLSPEHVGDLLSKSWSGEKRIVVTELSGAKQRFSVRVQGAWDQKEFWFHATTLDYHRPAVIADRMFVSENHRGQGFGRRFMGDLIETARLLGLTHISLDAENIDRYAWLRVGFVPDRGSWRLMGKDLLYRLAAAIPEIGTERFLELLAIILAPHPSAARELAALSQPVSSLVMFNSDGSGKLVPLGRALFLEIDSNWSGELDLSDRRSLRLADSYISGHRVAGDAAANPPTTLHPGHHWGPFADDPWNPRVG